MHAWFFAIDAIAIFAAILLGIALLVAAPRSVAARIAAYVLAVSAGFIVFSRAMFGGWIPPSYQIPVSEGFILAIQVLMNTSPGAFALLCFRLFDDSSRRFPPWLLGLFAFQVALEDLIPYVLGITTHPSFHATMTDTNTGLYLVFEVLPAVLQAVFVATALFLTVKDWRADLVEQRRLARVALVVVIGVNLVSYTLLSRLVLGDITMLYVHEAYQCFNILTNVVILIFLLRPTAPVPLFVAATPQADEVDPESALDSAALDAAMQQQVYREPGLTIASLAAKLSIPEYRLRRLINAQLGYRNFNQMLHAYRVADAAEALADPDKRHLPILTIALTAGYQSINPFNRAFKESKGVTPSAFRAQVQRSGQPNGGGTSHPDGVGPPG
ncbi:MAG TPA: helix-turn-helix domain-containing protein [Pseudomonadales bacterium]